jgi:hypothetical protein
MGPDGRCNIGKSSKVIVWKMVGWIDAAGVNRWVQLVDVE